MLTPLPCTSCGTTSVHKALRITPAMAAGVSDRVWSLEEVAGLAK